MKKSHPPPPAWGFSIRLLSISLRCCLNLSQSFFNIFCFSLSRCCSWLKYFQVKWAERKKEKKNRMTQHQDCPPVFKKQCFSATPEDSHVLHFNVKVKVAAHLQNFSLLTSSFPSSILTSSVYLSSFSLLGYSARSWEIKVNFYKVKSSNILILQIANLCTWEMNIGRLFWISGSV